jgi:hypothetical protein
MQHKTVQKIQKMSSYDNDSWMTDLKRFEKGHVVDCNHRDCSRDDGDGYGGFCNECEDFYCDRHEAELERDMCQICRQAKRADSRDQRDHFEHLEQFENEQITSVMLREAFQNCFGAHGMEVCLREHDHSRHRDDASGGKCSDAYESLKDAFNYFD